MNVYLQFRGDTKNALNQVPHGLEMLHGIMIQFITSSADFYSMVIQCQQDQGPSHGIPYYRPFRDPIVVGPYAMIALQPAELTKQKDNIMKRRFGALLLLAILKHVYLRFNQRIISTFIN